MKSAQSPPAVVPVYEDMLKRDRSWAMDEGDRHFQQNDAVFKTLRKIAGRLELAGVPYAIAGGMALEAHGFRRLTIGVDILVNRLSAEFATELNPYVRDKYLELWHGVQESPVGPVEPWPD